MIDYVSKQALADLLGISPRVIEGWIYNHWTKGDEYAVIGKTTLINKEKVNTWISQYYPEESGSGLQGYKSESPQANATSMKKRYPAATSGRVTSPARSKSATN